MDPIWYIGPPGDLRPLVCPEKDIVVSPERYGGVRQGLSGARSMDVTGLRMRYELQLNMLEPSEYSWLEALHFRHIPGPHRMINPLNKNRLAPETSSARAQIGTARGIGLTSGIPTRVWDWPTAAGMGAQSLKWTGRIGTSVARFDDDKKTSVIAGEQVTASIWMKGSSALSGSLVFDWFNRSTSMGNSALETFNLTTSWQKFTITRTVPAGVNLSNFALFTGTTGPDIFMTAAQFESGAVATDWVLGGGNPTVLIDQLEVVTPRFPYVSTKAILLEA